MNPRLVAFALAALLLVALPFWVSGIYYINVASQILFFAIFALGLNVLAGYGGLVSLGHAALFGIAAYATGYILDAGFGHPAAIFGMICRTCWTTASVDALPLVRIGIDVAGRPSRRTRLVCGEKPSCTKATSRR